MRSVSLALLAAANSLEVSFSAFFTLLKYSYEDLNSEGENIWVKVLGCSYSMYFY